MKGQRRSIRLKGYDYSQHGVYFVTICSNGRRCIFGEIADGQMLLNDYGRIVAEEWQRTPEIRKNVKLDEFVVMPNHVHGILWFLGDDTGRGVSQYAPTVEFRSPSGSLGAVIRGFKSAATKRIHEKQGIFGTAIWQRNYYEHIIRDERSLNRIREYIIHNPLRWHVDRDNPAAKPDAKEIEFWNLYT